MGRVNKTFNFNVNPAGSLPAWLAGLTDMVWSQLADGSGSGNLGGTKLSTVIAATGNQAFITNGHGGGAWNNNPDVSSTNAWTSACYDPDNQEYVHWANGGHSDYSGNETYVLALGVNTPFWRRINTPTPTAAIEATGSMVGSGSTFSDGRGRAMHNSFQDYADGRYWAGMMNSVTSQNGGAATTCASYGRTALGAAATPVDYANSGQWQFHPFPSAITSGDSTLKFGVGVADRIGHRYYAFAGEGYGVCPIWWYDTLNPATKDGVQTGQNGFGTIFAAGIADGLTPRIIIGLCSISNTFRYLDLTSDTTIKQGWKTPAAVTGTQPQFAVLGPYQTTQQNMSVCYDNVSHSFILLDPYRFGRQLWRLTIPRTGTAFNPAGTWAWSTNTPSGLTPPVRPDGNTLCYGKARLARIGGRQVIVFHGYSTVSAAALRLPAAGVSF